MAAADEQDAKWHRLVAYIKTDRRLLDHEKDDVAAILANVKPNQKREMEIHFELKELSYQLAEINEKMRDLYNEKEQLENGSD